MAKPLSGSLQGRLQYSSAKLEETGKLRRKKTHKLFQSAFLILKISQATIAIALLHLLNTRERLNYQYFNPDMLSHVKNFCRPLQCLAAFLRWLSKALRVMEDFFASFPISSATFWFPRKQPYSDNQWQFYFIVFAFFHSCFKRRYHQFRKKFSWQKLLRHILILTCTLQLQICLRRHRQLLFMHMKFPPEAEDQQLWTVYELIMN